MWILWFVGVEGLLLLLLSYWLSLQFAECLLLWWWCVPFWKNKGLHPFMLRCWRGKGCQVRASVHHINTLDSLRWLMREDSHLMRCFPSKAITIDLGSFFFGKLAGIWHQKSYFWLILFILFWTYFVQTVHFLLNMVRLYFVLLFATYLYRSLFQSRFDVRVPGTSWYRLSCMYYDVHAILPVRVLCLCYFT